MSTKIPVYHSGYFYCPKCCIEYDLHEEKSLKCDECNRRLLEGRLRDNECDDDSDESK